MSLRYELNSDVGEGFPYDDELMTVIDAANVACGFHAGDLATMRHLCALAAERGVRVGAQVSYRDREGFGRRDMDVPADQLAADLVQQVEALQNAAVSTGVGVTYLKPHGALYNRVVWDDDQATVVVDVARQFRLPVMGLPGSRCLDLAAARDLPVVREFFADRGYRSDGRLVPRGQDAALITDPVAVEERVRRLTSEGVVAAADGSLVRVVAESVCVHSDSAGALDLARAVRRALDQAEA